MVCQTSFYDNVYHTFSEFVYHMIMTFFISWRIGYDKMELQFNNLVHIRNKKIRNPHNESISFMYGEMYSNSYR